MHRILIADDNEEILAMLRKMFENARARFGVVVPVVDCAECGAQALQMYHQAMRDGVPYDLLLLDAMMSDMTGYAVAEKIRADGDALTPIAFLTADTSDFGTVRAQLTHSTAFWRKPDDLLKVIPGVLKILELGDEH